MGQAHARVLTGAPPVRDAATVILLRRTAAGPQVLMGQRGRHAAFMPSKFVFPGGAVDAEDAAIPLARPLDAETRAALAERSEISPEAIVAAATRELWEETGLVLGQPCAPGPAPPSWQSYTKTRHLPDGAAVKFVFRAITPPGRPRRFDARFLLVEAAALASDPDDFSRAGDELAHLQWVALEDVRTFDLPFITEIVLAEVAARLRGTAKTGVPFFDNSGATGVVSRL